MMQFRIYDNYEVYMNWLDFGRNIWWLSRLISIIYAIFSTLSDLNETWWVGSIGSPDEFISGVEVTEGHLMSSN